MKRPRCIQTLVCNEPVWWPIWRRYYSQWFSPQDIYINHVIKPKLTPFDDQVTDDCWRHGYEIIPFHESATLDFGLNTSRISRRACELLERYEQVITCEIDEFLVSPNGLGNYLANWEGKVGLATGYEIVHHFQEYKRLGIAQSPEPALDYSRPLLSQRAWWYRSLLYSKPVLTTVPITYRAGLHSCVEPEWTHHDPNLLLLHLHKIDWDLAVRRREDRKDQYGITDHNVKFGDELAAWWFNNVDGGHITASYESIPEWVRAIHL